MSIFNRQKKVKENTIHAIELKHEHVFKDFPWYIEIGYDGKNKTAKYRIIEPYVCITCGERIDKVLEKNSWTNITNEEREKIFNRVENKYKKYLKPRAVVEDMINNVLLVKDPGRLEMLEKMRGTPHIGCGTSAKMDKDIEFKIELKRNKDNANNE